MTLGDGVTVSKNDTATPSPRVILYLTGSDYCGITVPSPIVQFILKMKDAFLNVSAEPSR